MMIKFRACEQWYQRAASQEDTVCFVSGGKLFFKESDFEPMDLEMGAKEMKISRKDAIKIFCRATDQDDPYWDNLVEDHYDEDNDDWPTIYDVLEPLGVTKAEIDEAERSA